MKNFLFDPPDREGGLPFKIIEIIIGTWEKPAMLGDTIVPPIENLDIQGIIIPGVIPTGGSREIYRINLQADLEVGVLKNAIVIKKDKNVALELNGIIFVTNLLAEDYLKEAPPNPPPFPV